MSSERPNIVLITADQWNSTVVGALGHPTVLTPNIDRLVSRGTAFVNCYSSSPLCAPSRASMLTGKLVRHNHVYDNGAILSSEIPTLMHHLRRSGYDTALSGKVHYIGADQLHGFESRLTTNIYPASLDWTPDWRKKTYGNYGTSIRRCKITEPVSPWDMQRRYDEEVLYTTLQYIRDYGTGEKKQPFFLHTSFSNPHEPYTVQQEYWDLYEGKDIPLPTCNESFGDLHPFHQWLQIHHELDITELSTEDIKNYRRAYFGMLSYFDFNVGRIIKELKEQNLFENTLILLTSDHGDMLGEHGMWFKRAFFDGSQKIPLIAHWPGHVPRGRIENKVLSLVDLTPTLMELIDVKDREFWQADMDGDSFCELLFGAAPTWKDEAWCEYFSEGVLKTSATLRKGSFKLSVVHEHDSVLYNVEKDPSETRNLIDVEDFQEIRHSLESRIHDCIDFADIEKNVALSQRRRLLILEAMKTGSETCWDFQPQRDVTEEYVRFKGKICEYH